MAYSLTYRQGDSIPSTRDSDDRYFTLDDHWYFTTREGLVMGPYLSRAQAIGESRNYILFIRSAQRRIVNLFKRGQAIVQTESTAEDSLTD